MGGGAFEVRDKSSSAVRPLAASNRLGENRAMLSRALLLPGPLAPLSHFGLTLLRHTVASGLRYGFYHLGLALPETAPIRLVRLRLYFDGEELGRLLASDPAARVVGDALLDPGGAGAAPLPARLGAVAAFHRARLRLWPRRLSRRVRAADGEPSALWQGLRGELSRSLPATNDAFLAELLSALERRERRRRGEPAPPVVSRAAAAVCAGHRPPLERFGPPDPYHPSWARALAREGAALEALGDGPAPGAHPLRGRFRETYRALLDRLTPGFVELARGACERGLLGQLDDAFFLPLETADDLASSEPLRWLGPAIAANRREYAAFLQAAEPAEILERSDAVSGPSGPRPEWEWAPLLPLP